MKIDLSAKFQNVGLTDKHTDRLTLWKSLFWKSKDTYINWKALNFSIIDGRGKNYMSLV